MVWIWLMLVPSSPGNKPQQPPVSHLDTNIHQLACCLDVNQTFCHHKNWNFQFQQTKMCNQSKLVDTFAVEQLLSVDIQLSFLRYKDDTQFLQQHKASSYHSVPSVSWELFIDLIQINSSKWNELRNLLCRWIQHCLDCNEIDII